MAKHLAASSAAYLEVPHGRLFYEVAGNGPPVLLVHGLSLDTRMWEPQWLPFAERHRVVRVDMRGFGRSTSEAVPFDDMEDLVALLDHLAIDRVHIVGLSMGATLVVDFAIAHPERIHGLVPVDGGPSGAPGPPPDVLAIFQAAAEGRVDEAREAWLATALFAPAMEQPEVAGRLREMVEDFGWWRTRNPGLAQAPRSPATGRLGDISAPTLVVVGDRERPAVRQSCELLVNGIRGAQMVVLPGAGHMSNMEAPAAFNTAVLEFLSGL
jgi:pimeloyl-ACP methyl ester carboxylesterase